MVLYLFNDKVDLISVWDDKEAWEGQQYPSTIRLKEYIRKRPISPKFNRKAIFKRDSYTCMYTGAVLPAYKLTIDHVIPKDQGGKNTWENCVTCSTTANSEKRNRTPEQAGMTLLKKPTAPASSLFLEYSVFHKVHPDWADYFPEARSS